MLRLGRQDHEPLMVLLQRAAADDPTYAQLGATLAGPLPQGYRHVHRRLAIGGDPDGFARAVAGLRQWRAHRGAGVGVFPADLPVQAGATLVVVLRLGPIRVLAPLRVVAVVDEPGRFGFAYGTLPGHPERGEESFVVERDPDGAASFTITAFSRPATGYARLSGPLGRRAQTVVTGRYLTALATYAAGTGPAGPPRRQR
jgi:uncharacterized protein (UPF0548 family)